MNRAQLLQHFDTLAETPDAVAKLRAFVLDLAVRGQLVPQTSKLDKDADWQKFCGELDEHESPSLFEVPDAWRWVGRVREQPAVAFSPQPLSVRDRGRVRDLSVSTSSPNPRTVRDRGQSTNRQRMIGCESAIARKFRNSCVNSKTLIC